MLTDDLLDSLKRPIFFITPRIDWALGLANRLPNYHIICLHNHPNIDLLIEDSTSIFCLEREGIECNANSGSILSQPRVTEYIKQQSGDHQPVITYFKPSAQLDKLCAEHEYLKIANSSKLNRIFEDKIKFYQLFSEHPQIPQPPGFVAPTQNLTLEQLEHQLGLPVVMQTSRGWAGKTTHVVSQPDQLADLQSRLYNRVVKITKYLKAQTYINNACVLPNHVLVSEPALQIDPPGPEYSANPMSTCGRQWPVDSLSAQQAKQMHQITVYIGNQLRKAKYKGYFGVDFVVDEETQQVYVIEVNPRLTASSAYFTELELNHQQIPLLYYHLMSFIQPDHDILQNPEYDLLPVIWGTQLVMRNTSPYPLKLKADIPSGIYKLEDNRLVYDHPDYKPPQYPHKLLIHLPAPGTTINPHSELIRLESSTNLVMAGGRLDKPLHQALLELKQRLLAI